MAALTPIPYREVLGPTRDALITAFIAGDLFIVLPSLIESCKELLTKALPEPVRVRAICLMSWCLPRSISRIPESSCP